MVVPVRLWVPPLLASEDFKCSKDETQASGLLRKPQEVLIDQGSIMLLPAGSPSLERQRWGAAAEKAPSGEGVSF